MNVFRVTHGTAERSPMQREIHEATISHISNLTRGFTWSLQLDSNVISYLTCSDLVLPLLHGLTCHQLVAAASPSLPCLHLPSHGTTCPHLSSWSHLV